MSCVKAEAFERDGRVSVKTTDRHGDSGVTYESNGALIIGGNGHFGGTEVIGDTAERWMVWRALWEYERKKRQELEEAIEGGSR